jgi:hypothetical protein
MISWYDITIYDIIGVQVFFGFIFGYLCIKKYKMPLADARTRTLICTLKGSQSNHCTNGSLHYTIPLSLIIYTHFMKARHVGASSADPQCSRMPPSNMYHIEWYGILYDITFWYHILQNVISYKILWCHVWYHISLACTWMRCLVFFPATMACRVENPCL